jgi:small-conductance mechanosensitive channel
MDVQQYHDYSESDNDTVESPISQTQIPVLMSDPAFRAEVVEMRAAHREAIAARVALRTYVRQRHAEFKAAAQPHLDAIRALRQDALADIRTSEVKQVATQTKRHAATKRAALRKRYSLHPYDMAQLRMRTYRCSPYSDPSSPDFIRRLFRMRN